MSSRDKKLLIFLLGILFVAAGYFFVFKNSMEKREIIEDQNATLQARVDVLLGYVEKEDFYREQIDSMSRDINVIVAKYPVYLQDENEIMDVVALEKDTDTSVSTLTIVPAVAVPVVVEDTQSSEEEQSDSTDGVSNKYELYDYSITMNLSTGYDGFKKLINEIVKKDVRSVNNVMVTYDNTNGLLNGSVVYDAYFLYGQDKAYQAPDIPSVPHGTKNIFGSLSKPVVKETKSEDKNADKKDDKKEDKKETSQN